MGIFGSGDNPIPVAGGVEPFNAVPRSNSANHVGPSGMGTEGGAIGVINSVNLMEEFHPPMSRTVDEPSNEFLK